MKKHINNVQVIEQDGQAAFAVLPYDYYLDLMGKLNLLSEKDEDIFYPQGVAELLLISELSLLASWRKYLAMTQKELARRMGIVPSRVSVMEKIGAKPRPCYIELAAEAMGIAPQQLVD